MYTIESKVVHDFTPITEFKCEVCQAFPKQYPR